MEFITREGEPSPYQGEYMFQYMTDEETTLYTGVLSKSFENIFPTDPLQKIVQKRVRF